MAHERESSLYRGFIVEGLFAIKIGGLNQESRLVRKPVQNLVDASPVRSLVLLFHKFQLYLQMGKLGRSSSVQVTVELAIIHYP